MMNVPVLESETTPAAGDVAAASFEARWDAWQRRGAKHDRAVRARARILLPVLIALAVLVYFLVA
jgi:hypothetical protein